jgi:hypothetical protein
MKNNKQCALLLMLCFVSITSGIAQVLVKRQVTLMGSVFEISLVDRDSAITNQHIDEVISEIDRIENLISETSLFCVRNQVDTNILFIEINPNESSLDPVTLTSTICRLFKDRGILVSNWSPLLLRMVLHRDILEGDVTSVMEVIEIINKEIKWIE